MTEGRATRTTPDPIVDVAVVGAGVVGSAIAREFAIRGARTALIEARADVGDATSKANTAILHTGFDATPGTLESRLVARGYDLLRTYADRAGIPVEVTGGILVAWDGHQIEQLSALQDRAVRNGYLATDLLSAEQLYFREPMLGRGALGGLLIPDEGIICPWTTTLAFATEAVEHGALLRLETVVLGAEIGDRMTVLTTTSGQIAARVVVNAAGLGADRLHHAFGLSGFTVTPRRGQLMVFDKLARSLLGHILLPVPTAAGKGVLVAPTVYGNVVLGPTAEDVPDPAATDSTAEGVAFLLERGRLILPDLVEEEVTAIYAGLRAASEHTDYHVTFHEDLRYACVGGIRSTGLTASLAIAEYVAEHLDGMAGIRLAPMCHPEQDPSPARMPYIGEAHMRPYCDAAMIEADSWYGHIVCFCERATLGEIRDALHSAIPPRALEGLRRRTRATMGRCQGFYCGANVRRLLECHSNGECR